MVSVGSFKKSTVCSGTYHIWDLLLGCADSDVVKSTIEFLMFAIKDETIRDRLSKDTALVEAVRSVSAQMDDNGMHYKARFRHS